jgi:drug/metabolite transporter (DMT)-like permease
VSAQALLLVLAAAALHAGWNFIVKSSTDRLVAAWAIATMGAVVNLPVLVVLGLPDRSVAGWLAASAVLHVAYGYALAGAYDRVDLAAAYPIARGTAPLIVTVVSVPLLGDSVSLLGVAGIFLVTSSLAIIGLRHVPSGVSWAVLTGVMIAAYTLADGAGVRAGDESVRYIAALFVLHSLLFTVVLGVGRRSFSTMRFGLARQPRRLLVGGAASAGAYLLVMVAARTTPLGLVAGLRETSAGIGVLAGYAFLGERVTRQHAIAVAVAVVGGIAIAMS